MAAPQHGTPQSPFRGDVLASKVALITGGGSGIGLEISRQLGEADQRAGRRRAWAGGRRPHGAGGWLTLAAVGRSAVWQLHSVAARGTSRCCRTLWVEAGPAWLAGRLAAAQRAPSGHQDLRVARR